MNVADREVFIVAVYTDDILLVGESDEKMPKVKPLGKHFEVKDMGELCYFQGVKVLLQAHHANSTGMDVCEEDREIPKRYHGSWLATQ